MSIVVRIHEQEVNLSVILSEFLSKNEILLIFNYVEFKQQFSKFFKL